MSYRVIDVFIGIVREGKVVGVIRKDFFEKVKLWGVWRLRIGFG